MRVPLSWLREICPTELAPEDLSELLSWKGMHTESVIRPWAGLEGVVVARVIEVREHPDSVKLCLARVDFGAGEREVVVGVRNMKAGDLVPLAGPGTRVPALAEPMSARTIRGVRSEGMICSPRELGISSDHTGILILPNDAPVGSDFKQTFELDEVVLDLEIEANRPDELSIFGVAREVSAATGVSLRPPDVTVSEEGAPATKHAAVEVLDPEKCPRYLARVIADVAVRPSPIGVQARLTAAGMRPVSSVVDATNYVMLELGQPMHPFDLDLLEGAGVVVRRARPEERLVTLDGVARTLTEDDLVIADRSKAVGIAGVMGSADGEVHPETKLVLLESAYFEPRTIFRTSRRLALQTEASSRFSRGADPEVPGQAAARAARLMVEWSGGRVLAGAIDVGHAPPRRKLSIRPARASLLIGTDVSASDVAEAFGRLGIGAEKADGEVRVEVPGYRVDLQTEVDLVEEVVRVQGYDSLGSTLPRPEQVGSFQSSYELRRRIREVLVRAGLREATSLSSASEPDLALMGHSDAVRLANPPSADEPYLRTSLIPNLLKALARNRSRGRGGVALFEVGHVFAAGSDGGVQERETVAGAMWGPAGVGVNAERRDLDFFDGKGAVEALMEGLGISSWELGAAAGVPFHPARSAGVLISGSPAGVLGELHPGAAEEIDLSGRVVLFELDVETLASHGRGSPVFVDLPRFPPVHRDLAFVVDSSAPSGAMKASLMAAGGELLDAVVLFDVFEGPPLPAGKKNVAFSIDLRAPDRTLTDQETERVVAAIVRRLAADFGAEFRAG